MKLKRLKWIIRCLATILLRHIYQFSSMWGLYILTHMKMMGKGYNYVNVLNTQKALLIGFKFRL